MPPLKMPELDRERIDGAGIEAHGGLPSVGPTPPRPVFCYDEKLSRVWKEFVEHGSRSTTDDNQFGVLQGGQVTDEPHELLAGPSLVRRLSKGEQSPIEIGQNAERNVPSQSQPVRALGVDTACHAQGPPSPSSTGILDFSLKRRTKEGH